MEKNKENKTEKFLIESTNMDFSIKLNMLYGYIEKIKSSKAKIALYGNGLVANIIAKEIKEQLVVIADQNKNSKSEFAKTCLPNELENFDFDFLLITVLGRENDIISNLNIDKNKILTINLNKKNVINSLTDFIDIIECDIIYKLIESCELKLCIDVGAAKGYYTSLIFSASNNKAKIFAYEPFYGNHKFFYEEIKDLKNITLMKKALSDKVGKENFFVSSKVKGDEKGWEDLKGYSSLGMLSDVSNLDYKKYPEGENISIECTTIDTDFKNEHIDFIKIDVQGAEAKVLKGSENHLKKQKIDLLYIEWGGEMEVIDILTNNDYIIYDTIYLLSLLGNEAIDMDNLKLIKEINLSTGKTAYEVIIKNKNIVAIDTIKYLRTTQKTSFVQTDIIAVSKNFNNKFLQIMKDYNLNNKKN